MQRNTLVVLAALVAATGGASAFAAASADNGSIHACRHVKRGLVRVLRPNTVCKRNESPISWAISGPRGQQGPPGERGPQGEEGPQGPPGTARGGLARLESLVGLACTTFDGTAGTVDLDVTPENLVLVSCDPPGGTPDAPPDPGQGGTRLVINEVDYDQVGADTAGFVEIANPGDAAADLTGVALVLVNGGDSSEYGRVALTGTLAAGGHLKVEVEPQNGTPDGLALVSGTSLLDALSYEGEIRSATIGTSTYDLVEGTPLPAAVADSNTVEGSLVRAPDGTDTNDAAADWRFTTTPTPGAANVLSP